MARLLLILALAACTAPKVSPIKPDAGRDGGVCALGSECPERK